MNCKEARSHIEDALDETLSGGVKHRLDLHLQHCTECRAFFESEKAEFAHWCTAINHGGGRHHSLPADFADRLVAAVTAPRPLPFLLRLPRWVLVAASVAIAFIGFAFAAVVVERYVSDTPTVPPPDETAADKVDVPPQAANADGTPPLASTLTSTESLSVQMTESTDSNDSASDEISSNQQNGETAMNIKQVKNTVRGAVAALAVSTVGGSAPAGLIAKWDFDNFDPGNAQGTNILAATVGDFAAIPCRGNGVSIPVTDGTLGDIWVLDSTVAPGLALANGDLALAIPAGSHLKFPLPSGVVRNKNWMVRIRFCSPTASAGSTRAIVQGNWDNNSDAIWYISNLNLIWGQKSIFGDNGDENRNSVADDGWYGNQHENGAKAFRLVSSDEWHSFTAHFGPVGASSTLDGLRSVSLGSVTDIRSQFTDDGFLICADPDYSLERLIYIASVEVWEDAPLYHQANYIQTSSTLAFPSCSLNEIRDLYLSVKGLGAWCPYARVMSSWEHIVTTDYEGNATDLKIDFRGRNGSDAILCEFTNSGSDVNAWSLRNQWSLGWPNPYFTSSGGFTSDANWQAAPVSWSAYGYSPYNLYALPFRPVVGSLNWSMQMGSGKFGTPVLSVVGNNPTLTFDAAPEVDSLTLDCGRGDGKASITFAYGSGALKTMSGLGGLNIGENVKLNVPFGVSVAGALSFGRGACIEIDITGQSLSSGDVLFTATGGVTLPAGRSIEDVVRVDGSSVALSQDGTQILLVPNPSHVITANWSGLGDRSDVVDPQNWICMNCHGEVLADRIPGEGTTITIGGATSFNYPTNQTGRLTYKTIILTSPLTLTADCDWRGLGAAIPYAGTPSIDLQGYKLYVSDVASSAVVTDSTSGDPGEYHLDLATSATVTSLNLTGNARFVKEGSGELTLNYSVNPSYTGGTEIRGGIIASTQNAPQKNQFGPLGSEIVVRSGATLYPYNNENWLDMYKIVMDGGQIYTWYGAGNGVVIGGSDFTANSTWDVYSGGVLHMWGGHIVLNGHTLMLTGAGDKRLGAGGGGVTMTEGIVDLQNGTLTLDGPLNAPNTTFLVESAINPQSYEMNVGDYVPRYTGAYNPGTGAMNVYGTFKPAADHDKFYGCTIQDGATIDLSERDTPLPCVSDFTTGSTSLTFADGATIYVKPKQPLPRRVPIISWDDNTRPANLGTLTFRNGDPGNRAKFLKKDDGLYPPIGLVILIR